MKGEGDCSEQHFLPSIFEMPTSLRPTVKVSDSERASTYPIITTLCQVFFLKKSGEKGCFFSVKALQAYIPSSTCKGSNTCGNDLGDRIRQLLDNFIHAPG